MQLILLVHEWRHNYDINNSNISSENSSNPQHSSKRSYFSSNLPYIIVFEFLLLGIFPQRASYRGVSLQFEMFQAWEEKGYYAKLFT